MIDFQNTSFATLCSERASGSFACDRNPKSLFECGVVTHQSSVFRGGTKGGEVESVFFYF